MEEWKCIMKALDGRLILGRANGGGTPYASYQLTVQRGRGKKGEGKGRVTCALRRRREHRTCMPDRVRDAPNRCTWCASRSFTLSFR